MLYAYSNNGLSFRAITSSADLEAGEVEFNGLATSAELAAAFSGYTAAVAAQQVPINAAAALAGGLAVTSTSTSSLNGTYAVDSNTTAEINAEITSILLNTTFTDGTTALAWPDVTGAAHSFNVAQFKALATAIASFVTSVNKYARGQLSSLPPSTAVIA